MNVTFDADDSKQHILFIDDDESLIDIGKRNMQKLGFAVSAHICSLNALSAFQDQPYKYDAIITDLTMPNLNGMELARKISAIRPEIPIILCTGDRSAFTDEQIAACGIEEIVLKPLPMNKWATLLNKIFRSDF